MRRFKLTITIIAVAGLALCAAAQAHVTLQPSEAPAGEFTRLDVRVPNEQDEASTTKVDVQFPDGFVFASYEPVPGWRVKVTREKTSTPIEAEGEQFSEQIGRMTWTASGSEGRIGPGQFRDFGISTQMPDKPNTTLTFKANQTYSNGDVVRWIGPPDSDEPAPQVKIVTAGAGGNAASEQAAAVSSGSGDSDDSKTLAIVALIVGGLGLLAGGAAFLTRRRGT